jgi:L-lactate dehydrogenase complex protein LldG
MRGLPEEPESKQPFLQMVREALGRSEPLLYTPDHAPLKAKLPRQQEKVRTVQARNEARRPVLVARLMETAAKAGWNVHGVASHDEAALIVGDIARGLRARRVVRSTEEVFRRVEVDRVLRNARITPVVLVSGRQRRRSDLWPLASGADLGISGVQYAVAETGSCVVVPRRGIARITSLAPPAFIALVEEDQVLENLDDLLALRRLEYMRGRSRTPNYMTLISGPSRTADIEFTLTTGVHGPGQVHLILIS